ncbi:M18 family aminopeptidase [Clostridium sp. SHJSY1]|uniref:M18 family aminopeptidase n=1 Tax=Clostridium sp. SHJSY1 TaxID=2942483 RepID=UPI0028749CE8|nr:M18 family aminopeptidase [Clostridium sp. SHJSY1]MDS0526969.1 M18 family aminopeptidase [Clostridium sp. SHJSY1]
MEKKLALELLDFIEESPTAYHGAHSVKKILDKAGFKEIKENEKWNLVKGGKYYVMKNQSAIISFEIGQGELEEDGFRLIGAHTDSPTFKIKPAAEMEMEEAYIKLNTEVYGSPIISTWLDRPLSLAGRVVVKGKSPLKPEIRLVNIDRPLLIIPNVAIHMNREVNEGYTFNKQKDTLPLLGLINEKFEKDAYLLTLLSEQLSVEKESILDFDLFLYEYEKGCILGLENEFISAGRLDDLWMVFTGVKALIDSEKIKATKVMVAVDNEEIGSLTAQGARAALVKTLLERIALSLGKDKEGFFRALSNSIMISADLAHAIHPNHEDKHDPTNKPVLGGGPVIKMAASGSYSTDSYTSAIFQAVCKESGVPCQKFVNRSDAKGGTTIGPMSAADLSIPVIDMGAPVLGMHSVRELAAVKDNYFTVEAFTKFFNI